MSKQLSLSINTSELSSSRNSTEPMSSLLPSSDKKENDPFYLPSRRMLVTTIYRKLKCFLEEEMERISSPTSLNYKTPGKSTFSVFVSMSDINDRAGRSVLHSERLIDVYALPVMILPTSWLLLNDNSFFSTILSFQRPVSLIIQHYDFPDCGTGFPFALFNCNCPCATETQSSDCSGFFRWKVWIMNRVLIGSYSGMQCNDLKTSVEDILIHHLYSMGKISFSNAYKPSKFDWERCSRIYVI